MLRRTLTTAFQRRCRLLLAPGTRSKVERTIIKESKSHQGGALYEGRVKSMIEDLCIAMKGNSWAYVDPKDGGYTVHLFRDGTLFPAGRKLKAAANDALRGLSAGEREAVLESLVTGCSCLLRARAKGEAPPPSRSDPPAATPSPARATRPAASNGDEIRVNRFTVVKPDIFVQDIEGKPLKWVDLLKLVKEISQDAFVFDVDAGLRFEALTGPNQGKLEAADVEFDNLLGEVPSTPLPTTLTRCCSCCGPTSWRSI
jgi:hypothetical protein